MGPDSDPRHRADTQPRRMYCGTTGTMKLRTTWTTPVDTSREDELLARSRQIAVSRRDSGA